MNNPCNEFGGDSNAYMNLEGRRRNTERWLAELFGELIARGISEDEHLHYKDSPLGGCYAPTLQELKEVSLGMVSENLHSLLLDHLEEIVKDYQKGGDQ